MHKDFQLSKELVYFQISVLSYDNKITLITSEIFDSTENFPSIEKKRVQTNWRTGQVEAPAGGIQGGKSNLI